MENTSALIAEMKSDILPRMRKAKNCKELKESFAVLEKAFCAHPIAIFVYIYTINVIFTISRGGEFDFLASHSTQYTYEELSAIEFDLKEQTSALKTYIQNRSMKRAKNSAFIIMDLLEERENKIFEIENNRI